MANVRFRFLAFTAALAASSGVWGQEGIDLESTFVGDKEQPSVSYFIPWKPPEGPERLYRSITSVSGRVFEVVDRDIHSRTMKFYDELSLEAPDGSTK
ncbi:hypothetical protein [Marinobacter sp. F4216]|uniref:hypothetical protein n=1 Tax=Marinobacter sp. F4216 TaxID=2874281 RepID=UPI001CBCFB64|nr:hypothetical protein [Marinobacter sp. F4216]MBZ2169075.1 hypothetical protein [Marinobacter sp. F4216]